LKMAQQLATTSNMLAKLAADQDEGSWDHSVEVLGERGSR
jgi:hypothetical protein